MDPANFNRSIRRLLRSTDGIIQASARDVAPISAIEKAALIEAYDQHMSDLLKEVKPEEVGSGLARRMTYAGAWLEAYTDTQVFQELELILRAVGEGASVIALSSHDSPERRNADDVVEYGGRTACTLLTYACLNISALQHIRGSAPHVQRIHALAARVVAPMTKAGFMSAVCNAARGMVAVAARMRSAVGVAECFGPMFNVRGASAQSNGKAGFLARTVCQYLRTIVESQFYHMGSPSIRSEALQVYGTLADSQLLATAAVILVDTPPAGTAATLPDNERDNIRSSTLDASESAATALFYLFEVRRELAARGNRQGKRLSAALLCAARHEAVQRLQVALLDQLAAHAGMAAGLEEWEAGSGPREGRDEERQGRGCGWEGSSGTWWLAREGAAQGKLLGLDERSAGGSRKAGKKARSNDAGWLEDYHCHIMRVTVQDWLTTDPGEAAAAGVPAAPPPLLVARLAARAAEALCRLCRGQGLEGAYAPAPEWQFATTKALVLSMLPAPTGTTVGACAPYWLEAGGWLTALLVDATAAAMGRLPSTKRPDTPQSMLSRLAEHSPADLLDQVSFYLIRLAIERSGKPSTSIQVTTSADMRRRMSRCGLAASMDHTLRLTYSAQDAGDAEVATFLGRTRTAWSWALDARLLSLIPPTDGQGSGASQAEGGGSTDGGGRGEGQAQLGVLLTLSKRAAMLTRALEAVCGSGAAGTGERAPGQGAEQRRRQILDWAADLLALLVGSAHSMEGSVRERVEAAGRKAAAVSGVGGSSDAVWREEGVCLDEVQEALAQAARAASNLAAPLAFELAVDIGTAAREAAARGRVVQWSSAQELGPHATCELLGCTLQWWRYSLLPPAQLMACQPHRLLAAACALTAALPGLQVSASQELESKRQRLFVLVPDLLAVMSAHETLSGRVREWLAPPPAAGSSRASGGGGGSSGSAAEPEACAGCLEAPVRSVTKRALKAAPQDAVLALALLKIAAGQGNGTAGWMGADGGFRQFAAAVKDFVLEGLDNSSRGSIADVPMPDGSTLADVLLEEMGGVCGLPPPPPPVAPSGVLPPPLALPPCQGALPLLRVCGNPHCGNFAEECEGALPLKQCGGCRAVRYCGADCQRGHWRAGHRAECKLMVAEAGQ